MKTPPETLSQLRKLRAAVAANFSTEQTQADTLGAAMEKIAANADLAPEAKDRQAKALRAAALPKIAECVRAIDADVATATGLRPRLESRELWLALAPFAADATADAAIRAARLAELALTPSGALQARFDAAVQDADLAEVWVCWVSGLQRRGEGWAGADLSSVALPQMQEALGLVAQIEATGAAAHSVHALAAGQQPTGFARAAANYAAARSRQAMQPALTTRPNSHGRPPVAS